MKIDIIRSLQAAQWKAQKIESEIWTGRTIGEYSLKQEQRITYINGLARQINQTIEDLLTAAQKEKDDAR